MKLYRCKHCGQIVAVLKESKVPLMCCGEKMEELVAGAVDASKEKHVPVVEKLENKVKVYVGSVNHPMEEAHYIEWVAIQTVKGYSIKHLAPGAEPKACFPICECDEFVCAYAYCNLHGLWKSN